MIRSGFSALSISFIICEVLTSSNNRHMAGCVCLRAPGGLERRSGQDDHRSGREVALLLRCRIVAIFSKELYQLCLYKKFESDASERRTRRVSGCELD